MFCRTKASKSQLEHGQKIVPFFKLYSEVVLSIPVQNDLLTNSALDNIFKMRDWNTFSQVLSAEKVDMVSRQDYHSILIYTPSTYLFTLRDDDWLFVKFIIFWEELL